MANYFQLAHTTSPLFSTRTAQLLSAFVFSFPKMISFEQRGPYLKIQICKPLCQIISKKYDSFDGSRYSALKGPHTAG